MARTLNFEHIVSKVSFDADLKFIFITKLLVKVLHNVQLITPIRPHVTFRNVFKDHYIIMQWPLYFKGYSLTVTTDMTANEISIDMTVSVLKLWENIELCDPGELRQVSKLEHLDFEFW